MNVYFKIICLLVKLLKYVESRLFVSSGLGEIGVYSPQFLVNPITQNTIVVTYVTLFIYWQKLNVHGSKTCF